MTPADLQFLQQDEARRALARLAATPIGAQNELALAAALRREFGPAHARLLLAQAILRQKGRLKFARADAMFFTRSGLEQASGERIARLRAGRYAAAGVTRVVDLGCGIGGDAIGLTAVATVIGIDRSARRLRLARHNVAIYGETGQFWPLQADLLTLPVLAADAFFFDPARRDAQGRRLYDPARYSPPLSLLARWLPQVAQGAAKVSPGIDYRALPAGGEAEFVSVDGDVKECLLWYGDLRSRARRRATLLGPDPEPATLTDLAPASDLVGPVGRYLYEPGGAVIRAHLVTQLAARLNGWRLDETIAYLSSDTLQTTPFATAYRVSDWFPFQLKRLRAYVRSRSAGILTIKKRGSPLDPDQLRRQLRPRGNNALTLILTRLQGEPIVIVAAPVG